MTAVAGALPGWLPAERDAWVALASVEGVGPVLFARLVARHGGATGVLRLARQGRLERIRPCPGGTPERALSARVLDRLRQVARDPDAVTRRLEGLGLWTLTPFDLDYPDRLRELDPPPAVLFGQGDRGALAPVRAVAVVGTRRPTHHGRDLAARIATRLAACHAVVVSGLALGIDGVAHAATVSAGGVTVAVLGGGHATAGPRAHRALRERIVASGGAAISEYAPDVQASRGTFPQRNRIISGLSDATIVVEAPLRSGALITARLALEQGRPLLVAPGRPFDRATAGCLALLRETPARPLVGLDEFVVDLGLDGAPETPLAAGPPGVLSAAGALRLLGPAERAVAEVVRGGPTDTDALVQRTGLPTAVVAGALTLLLLRGWVQTVGAAYLPAGPLLVDGPP